MKTKEVFKRVPYTDKETWLNLRVLGGSSASAIIGENPYMSNVDVWEKLMKKKKGVIFDSEQEELDSKPFIIYGKKAEHYIRELFALDYPQYEVLHTEEVLISNYYDFITASLDGELIEKETGKRGVLEIKTTEIMSSMHREKWGKDGERQVPQNYYIQCLHYLYVTGYDFVVLHVQLKYDYKREGIVTTRKTYRWEREEVLEDMKYLITKEVEFYNNYVLTETKPPRIINF